MQRNKMLFKSGNVELWIFENGEDWSFGLKADSEIAGIGMTYLPIKTTSSIIDVKNVIKNFCKIAIEASVENTDSLKNELTKKTEEAKQFWNNLQERNKLVEEMVKVDAVQNTTITKQSKEIESLKAQLAAAKKPSGRRLY